MTTIETAREYAGHRNCNPLNGGIAGCIICREGPDELSCVRGRHCSARGLAGRGAAIGFWFGYDPETTCDIPRETQAWEYPSLPGVLFCEDCVSDIDDGEAGQIVLVGKVDDIHWDVVVLDEGFGWCLSTVDRTGGTSWELEGDRELASVGAAVTFARTEAERLSILELDDEIRSGLHQEPWKACVPVTCTPEEGLVEGEVVVVVVDRPLYAKARLATGKNGLTLISPIEES